VSLVFSMGNQQHASENIAPGVGGIVPALQDGSSRDPGPGARVFDGILFAHNKIFWGGGR
jgi:hypothetical protein